MSRRLDPQEAIVGGLRKTPPRLSTWPHSAPSQAKCHIAISVPRATISMSPHERVCRRIWSGTAQEREGSGPKRSTRPVHKLLVKDIMHWNNAWGDDAFANGKISSWEVWLRERSLL